MENKVIWFETIGGHGGCEFYNYGYCQSLSILGIKTTLITCSETNLQKYIETGYTTKKYFVNIYNVNILLKYIRYTIGMIRTVSYAKVNKFNIVHVHLFHGSIIEKFNVLLFKLFKLKVIATMHDVESFDTFYSDKKNRFKSILNSVDGLILHSEFSLNIFKNKYSDFDTNKIFKVDHFDNDVLYKNNLSKGEARLKLKINNLDKIFLFFGQIKEVKGVDVLLEALFILREKYKTNIKCVIAGKYWKSDEKKYIDLIKKYNLTDSIILRSCYIANEEVPLYFASADAIILPYKRIYNSGVLIRSLDYNSFIIASDHDLMKEYITHKKNGYLFENENPDSLAKNMFDFLSLSEKDIQIVKSFNASERKIEHVFNNIGSQLMAIYNKIL